MQNESANVTLTTNEALVLYEFLARTAAARLLDPLTEDQSELRVLWDVEAMLERLLPDVLAADYADRLSAARAAVRDDPT